MAALDWISRKSLDIADLNKPAAVRTALDALKLKQDGTPAAENTVNRKKPVFSNCLRYAVERELLTTLPLDKVDWTPPQTDDEIDFRFVPGPKLAKQLITSVGNQGERGRHLKAFFGCLYYAANRPGEAANLREDAFTLPEEGWGEVLLSTSTPRVGSGWTDTGESFDTRGLKKRARKATRAVPIPPVLVRMIREHIKEFGTAEDGRLFRAIQGGHLLSKEYGEVWQAARLEVLTESEAASPLADVPYSLRHAGVSLCLDSGVSPAEVARRAGHSIAVLYRFYAKAIHRNPTLEPADPTGPRGSRRRITPALAVNHEGATLIPRREGWRLRVLRRSCAWSTLGPPMAHSRGVTCGFLAPVGLILVHAWSTDTGQRRDRGGSR
ncbi:hypothetical protein HRW07_04130 [Streptomyces lunaelactis]|uniref:tyrosine-type recombinase/integrase n=1 Tax=Streptomyces lunaelactis TaxID=1535768 RepID=UPI0015853224|nr:hypothetical protein [Streptomyces lunaelactis]NUL02445.1 hypothetical protein [Streptomyces lunaelactis]